MPKRSSMRSRSSVVVAGVMRSTIELGNATFCAIHSARPGSRSRAKDVNAVRATSPLPWMLSQDTTVKGAMPRSRRRRNASTTIPKTLAGVSAPRSARTGGASTSKAPVTWSTLYPPSVMVSETMRMPGAASRSMAASWSSGAWTKSRIDPMVLASQVPSGCLSTSV